MQISPYYTVSAMPQAFIWRRLHSLMGIWLVIFLIEHLFLNSQAALFIGGDGLSFIRGVNGLHEIPYLPVIELGLLGLPFFIHIIWGIRYLLTSKMNSWRNTGKDPYLPEYSRNRAYSWQRITSWILVVAVIAHVAHMRFIHYPIQAPGGKEKAWMIPVSQDDGLHTLAARLDVKLYDQREIQSLINRNLSANEASQATLLGSLFLTIKEILQKTKEKKEYEKPHSLLAIQQKEIQSNWVATLERHPLKKGEVMAVTKDFGTAELLMLRDTFKSPIMILLYSLFVIFACFHAFNGLWTFLISWGVILTERSQKIMLRLSYFLLITLGFLGLAAVWLTYWINLKR